MYALLLAFLLPAQLGPVVSPGGSSAVVVQYHPDGRPRIIEGALFSVAPDEDPRSALASFRGLLQLEPEDTFVLLEDVVEPKGSRHVRLGRARQGVSVEHDQARLHLTPAGIATRIEVEFSSLRGYRAVTPRLSPGQAVELARQGYRGRLDAEPEATPVVLGAQWAGAPRLAYRVLISRRRSRQLPYVRDVYIDALDGRIVATISRLYSQGVTMTEADLDGVPRSLRVTYFSQPDSVAMQESVTVPNGGILATADGSRGSAVYTTPNANTPFGDPVAVSVHDVVRRAAEFFETEYGWSRWDFGTSPAGEGGILVGVAHEGVDLANAYFTVGQGGSGAVGILAFGDGDGEELRELARCQDVATHELGHGLINATANLTYQFQSGALNEHFADVFGWLHDQADDVIAEDCIGPALSTPLRDMCDPGSVDRPQPDSMSEYVHLPNTESGNFGGVHINSGIPNRAACLARDQIGADLLSRIWFRALRFHLGPTSDFAAMVDATAVSCAELGSSSSTCAAIAAAWSAVGLGQEAPAPTTRDCPSNSTQVGAECYCDAGYAPSPDGERCLSETFADCPSNSHREDGRCVCDPCYQGLPEDNGTGCTAIPGCTVCDDPLERSGPDGCECIPGIVEVCGPRSMEFEVTVDGQVLSGERCCQPGDPCGLGADGLCDCFGECGWDASDCGSAAPIGTACRAREAGNCGDENWVGRCAGNTLIYCDDQSQPGTPFVVYGDCAEAGQACGFDPEQQMFNCIETTCDLPPEGSCEGNVARWCTAAGEAELDCGARPCRRYTSNGETLNFCFPCAANEVLVDDECACEDGFLRDARGDCVDPGASGRKGGGCKASGSAMLFLLLARRRARGSRRIAAS